ncbi:2-oxoacid:acceptor oxidoreductase subunit alpha [Arhodomonas sp. SL1]|uniref:2-oxoacid:acceptor oxidoreductase subunit alpha n=1 Tax=Arhodomonas sp. SL1 TaxID=3425691 RepID=UPI003F881FB4
MGDGSIGLAIMGSGGTGVMTAGQLLLATAADAGWYGRMGRSFGPQIRGGEAAALLRLSPRPIQAPPDRFELVLAFDWSNIERFAAEIPLDEGTLVLHDPDAGDVPDLITEHGPTTAEVNLRQLAKGIDGGRVNMIALGLLGALIGLPGQRTRARVEATMAARGSASVTSALGCIEQGAELAGTVDFLTPFTTASPAQPRWLISGNEATGLGAVRGGIRFVAAYPITPATEVLEWLSPELPRLGGCLVQAEDELASVNMCIGASFGGTPALTATSGPGLALMTEGIGLAVASETPLVVVDVMRGGPSTGIPTKSEQADLDIALHGLHGDAPHLVIAPNGLEDCIHATQWATRLAEALQAPAVVLTDQAMGQTRAIIDRPAERDFQLGRRIAGEGDLEDYRRYRDTADGVSPMSLPGTAGGEYTADGLEHDEGGTPSSRGADHQAQLDKRRRKLTAFDYGDYWADVEGEGHVALITWGSVTAAAREAAERLTTGGYACRLISLRLLAPARPKAMAQALAGVERALVVEQSHDGQFLRHLRAHYTIDADLVPLHRPGPMPLSPGEIVSAVAGLFDREAV